MSDRYEDLSPADRIVESVNYLARKLRIAAEEVVAATSDVENVAMRLFVEIIPKQDPLEMEAYRDAASMCFDAAEAFVAEAERRAELAEKDDDAENGDES